MVVVTNISVVNVITETFITENPTVVQSAKA
jgi:hypothetical protein